MSHKADKLAALQRIAAAAFEAQARKHAELTQAKAELATRQERLAQMDADALSDFAGPHPAHWHGGAVQWQAWVTQNARKLSMEEARLRAQQEIHLPALRKAFGKREVLTRLCRAEQKKPTSSG